MRGCICGGIIPESYLKKSLAKKDGIYEVMMCYIMPDKQYEKFKKLEKAGEEEKAKRLFRKYAWSIQNG